MIELPYGTGAIHLELPSERVGRELRSTAGAARASASVVAEALHALETADLSGRVGLLVSDGTRDWCPAAVVPASLEKLRAARELTVFVCNGTHEADSRENQDVLRQLRAFLADARLEARIVVNDARGGEFVDCGRTSRGTRLEFHPALGECDSFLVLAEMRHHYFAGYSNPVKYFLPGLASFETARGNHSLALEEAAAAGLHPWHPRPERRGNPLAEDMVEGLATLLAGRRAQALVYRRAGAGVGWATCGELASASARGMQHADEHGSRAVEPARFLVVSAGGHPYDESLYMAQRALELSRTAVRAGGEVLFLAECRNGIGPPSARENFIAPLQRPLAELQGSLPGDYAMYSHKPVRMARTLARLERLSLMSRLDPALVTSIHLTPAPEPQRVLDEWLGRMGPEDRVHVIADGSRLLVGG